MQPHAGDIVVGKVYTESRAHLAESAFFFTFACVKPIPL